MVSIESIGIDYYTSHIHEWGMARRLDLAQVLEYYTDKSGQMSPLSYKQLLGYQGYGNEHGFVGQREDGYLRRFSSAAADWMFDKIHEPEDKVSRLDIQITIKDQYEPNDIIAGHCPSIALKNMELPESRRRRVTEWKDNVGGYTLYVGSRSSEQFCRIYNKEAESREAEWKGCVRYEIQFSGDSATHYARQLGEWGSDRDILTLELIRHWLADRGVHLVLPATIAAWEFKRPQLAKTDIGTTLNWLEKQVRPAIVRLLRVLPEHEIMNALGLSESGLS